MANENTQSNENTSFNDQADGNMKKAIQNAKNKIEKDQDPEVNAQSEVRENEDASLQDDSYSFDEDNTDNDEYHDVDDMDFDNDDDFVI